MLHDPDIYPDPFAFNPDRHIATAEREAQRDPRTICFGYGRRICPGMYLAEASLFSLVVNALAVFDISKTVENGVEITPVHRNTSGIIRSVFFFPQTFLAGLVGTEALVVCSYPEQYKCTIKPRSEKAVSLITRELHL